MVPCIRVVLADDHGVVRKGLRYLLSQEPAIEVVGEASDGEEAVALCEALRPQVALLDIAMPKLTGLEAAARIGRASPMTAVIVLSMHSDEEYVLRALQAGAKGYLLKDAAEPDLARAVRAVAEGKTFFSPAVAEMLLDDYLRQLQAAQTPDSLDLLTGRERQVLRLIAEGKTNKETAMLLDLGVSTVETHRNNLMQKLNLRNTAEIVLYAVRKKVVI